MKIKQEKKFTLPQLIEWAWDNPKSSRNKRFVSENKDFLHINQYVIFNEVGYAEIENSYCYGRNDLFTVEVEEEIDEDTKIPKMVEIYLDNERDIPYSQIHYNQTINQAINTQEYGSKTLAFHKFNDDDTLTLIWRNGKLVE